MPRRASRAGRTACLAQTGLRASSGDCKVRNNSPRALLFLPPGFAASAGQGEREDYARSEGGRGKLPPEGRFSTFYHSSRLRSRASIRASQELFCSGGRAVNVRARVGHEATQGGSSVSGLKRPLQRSHLIMGLRGAANEGTWKGQALRQARQPMQACSSTVTRPFSCLRMAPAGQAPRAGGRVAVQAGHGSVTQAGHVFFFCPQGVQASAAGVLRSVAPGFAGNHAAVTGNAAFRVEGDGVFLHEASFSAGQTRATFTRV